MDSVAGRPGIPRRDDADSPNLMVVKDAFEALEAGGVEAGLERLLSRAHADLEFRPYLAPERVLRGVEEVRAFFREQLAAGTALTLRPSSIEENGEEVVVLGSLRVLRPTGGFSESQLRWTYRFKDGLLREARWGPRQAA
jgi:ketosteroid isomerase-like protein